MMKQILFLITLLCMAATASAQTEVEADSLRLDSLLTQMPELMVEGERPLVRAEAGKLVYDLPRLVENRAVDNVFEALKYLPGVTEQGESLTLGGRAVTVIIDDKPQSLTADQLASLLKAMPVGRLKDAEVMLSAPPQYGIRGAAINLHLRRAEGNRTLQGEALAQYRHRHFDDYVQRANILWQHNRSCLDFLYQHAHGRSYSTTDKEARHTLLDPLADDEISLSLGRSNSSSAIQRGTLTTLIPLSMHQIAEGRRHEHQFRLGFDHDFGKKHRLSATYYSTFTTSHARDLTTGSESSTSQINHRPSLHDLRIDYRLPFGLTATGELTNYVSPKDETLSSDLLGERLDLITDSRQRITRYRIHLDQEHALPHSWTLNYGIFLTHSRDHSYQDFSPLLSVGSSSGSATSATLPSSLSSLRRERTLNLYASLAHTFSARLMASASLAAEYYSTPERCRWDPYPVLNLTFLRADGHTLQLSINSDKDYPGYWALQKTTSYMGRYSEIQGTPDLRPSREYSASLQYILRNKYIFSLNYAYTDDYFVQILYQSPLRLVEIYRNVNFRYLQQLNLRLSAPFKVGRWLDARVTAIGMRDQIRIDDYFIDDAATIRRHKLALFGILNATVTLPRLPRLQLVVNGFVRTAGIQGLYDLPASGNLDLKLRYSFLNDRLRLIVFTGDLFRTAGISPRMDYTPSVGAGGNSVATPQYVINRYSCFCSLGFTVSYKFGGYKEKKHEAVDTSRFR